jgi:hypothetical protein
MSQNYRINSISFGRQTVRLQPMRDYLGLEENCRQLGRTEFQKPFPDRTMGAVKTRLGRSPTISGDVLSS